MCVTPRGSGVVGSGVVHTLHLYRRAKRRAAKKQTKESKRNFLFVELHFLELL